jgi:hypothetical protein
MRQNREMDVIDAIRGMRRAVLAIAFSGVAPLAAAEGKHIWSFGLNGEKPSVAHLVYGVPETDDSLGDFHCNAHSGAATLFVSVTDGKGKAGKTATAILSVGKTQTKVAGKLLPNEEAGALSFEGRLAANDPIFEAMAQGEKLVVTFGDFKQFAPLAGAAENVRKFIAACKEK